MPKSPFDPAELIKQFQAEQLKFKQESKIQFDSLIGTIKELGLQTTGTFDDALSKIQGLGDTARTRADKSGKRALASGQQDLITSGFAQSTLGPNLRNQVQEQTELQQQGIDEQVGAQQAGLLTQKAGNQTQIGGLLANAIQGQNITGPDLGLFATLLQQASAAGDGSKVNAFVPATSAALNSPGFGSRPGGGGGGTTTSAGPQASDAAAPAGPTGGSKASIVSRATAGLGAPTSTAGNRNIIGSQGQSLLPKKKAPSNGCPPGTRLFPGIGCF
jgi:hypothetical protein